MSLITVCSRLSWPRSDVCFAAGSVIPSRPTIIRVVQSTSTIKPGTARAEASHTQRASRRARGLVARRLRVPSWFTRLRPTSSIDRLLECLSPTHADLCDRVRSEAG
jgi:hypothetical protein